MNTRAHEEAIKRINKLRALIDEHRYAYHVLDHPSVSDAVDDSLKHELTELEKEFPDLITPDSPTQRVGGKPLPFFNTATHPTPILSINDAFTHEEVVDWQTRNEKILEKAIDGYFGELKMDGLAIVLTYVHGLLTRGATRGDGKTGEDVTHNIRTIESIPLHLHFGVKKWPETLYVRGEIVIEKKELARINTLQKQHGEKEFANPRNLAAGSIRQLDPKITATRKMDFYAFDILSETGLVTHAQVHATLKDWGFKINNRCEELKNIDATRRYIEYQQKTRKRLPYQTDGVVLVVNNLALQKKLGAVGKAERWMIAYKFPAEQATTIILDIIIQVGRTGVLTPVALLKPIKIAGSTVARATLHNIEQIKRLGIKIGDTVVVEKAGDVIPAVVNVFPQLRTGKERNFHIPTICPSCGDTVEQKQGFVALLCANPHCPAKHRENIYHFVSRTGFDIEGLGIKIVDVLYDHGLIKDAADLFFLTPEQLIDLEGFAELKAKKIIKAINEKKVISLPRFLYALGILHVGEETAQNIAHELCTEINSNGFLNVLQHMTIENWQTMNDIGPAVAHSIYNFFRNNKNNNFIEKLFRAGINIEPPTLTTTGLKFQGKTFVLTGTLSSLSREDAKQKIRNLGGLITESVSKKTSYVVVGENPGTKIVEAKIRNIPVLDEHGFLKLLQ